MTLLGSVQTYFGVLLTLAVLQIFYRGKNSENYFLKLVEYLGQETLDKFERLSRSLINQKKKEIKKIECDTTREKLTVSLTKVDTVKLIIHSDLEKRLKLINKNETPQYVALYSLLFGLLSTH